MPNKRLPGGISEAGMGRGLRSLTVAPRLGVKPNLIL